MRIEITEKDGRFSVLIVGSSAWGIGVDFARHDSAFDVAQAICNAKRREGAEVELVDNTSAA